MQFPRTLKPEVFASDDATRPHLANVYLDTARKTLAATNGHVMIAIPVTVDDDDHTGFITRPALAAARKAAKRGEHARIAANGTLAVDGASFERPGNPQDFPPYDRVLESARKQTMRATIGVDAKYLAAVFTALGDGIVKLEIGGDLDPIRVTRTDAEGGAAEVIIMPCRLDGPPARKRGRR